MRPRSPVRPSVVGTAPGASLLMLVARDDASQSSGEEATPATPATTAGADASTDTTGTSATPTEAPASSAPPADVGGLDLRPVIGVFSQQTDTITDSDSIDPTVEAELSVLETGDGDVTSDDVIAVNLPLSLQYTPDAAESRLFSSMPADVVESLGDQALSSSSA